MRGLVAWRAATARAVSWQRSSGLLTRSARGTTASRSPARSAWVRPRSSRWTPAVRPARVPEALAEVRPCRSRIRVAMAPSVGRGPRDPGARRHLRGGRVTAYDRTSVVGVIVDSAVYRQGQRIVDDLPAAELGRVRKLATEPGDLVWVGLHEPTEDELATVEEEFGLHPLAVEDAFMAHQRP